MDSTVNTIKFMSSIVLRSSYSLDKVSLDPNCVLGNLESSVAMKRVPRISRKVIYCSLLITCLNGEYIAVMVVQPFHDSTTTLVACKKSL